MFRSIRAKLTLWNVGILGLVFAAFAFATYTIFLNILKDEIRTNVAEMATNFIKSANQLQLERPHERDTDGLIREVLDEFNFRDYHFVVLTLAGRSIGRTGDLDLPETVVADLADGRLVQLGSGDGSYMVFERNFTLHSKQFRLFVMYSLSDQKAVESRLANTFLVTAPVLLLLSGLVGYLLARRSLRPVATMGERAKQIGAENLHERLPIANPKDEIGNLATVFNQLLDRLDQEFERQRRFMADASHELRTPLAIVRGESEVALQKQDRSDEEYRESLRIVNDEGKRLSKIVEDLFTLARVDSGSIQGSFREVYVDEILEDVAVKIRTLAERRGITVSVETEEMAIQGDEALLRRLFLNLLDNAVKYNREGGLIYVTASGRRVTVSNTGPEIPPEHQELIFERFYRVDKAHSRASETFTSGAGLGLSIARWIAELHHATLRLERSDEGENIFSVTFES